MGKMGLAADAEDPTFKKHLKLVKELNLDEQTASQAWTNFQSISSKYTLEGDVTHWLGCSIYVACRLCSTQTLSKNVVKGNPISLTSLLRFCNLSLQQFFNKIVNWVDMAEMPEEEEFRKTMKKLEGNFNVTCNIYKEFCPMFAKIFKSPDMDVASTHRNRKQKPAPCTPMKIFEFTWLLFITVKGRHVACNNDLVKSFHFILACCDLAFKNAFLSDRRDLLNPDFEGLPANWASSSYQTPAEAPCIIDKIWAQHKDMLADAKYDKEYYFVKFVREMFRDDVLQGNADGFTGLFDPENFDYNYNSVAKMYEHSILNDGDFDEKIFLGEYHRQIILRKCPATPLTGRKYLGPKEQSDMSVLTSVTQSIAHLQTMLAGRTAAPSEVLLAMFKTCENNPTDIINEVIDRLGARFLANFSEDTEDLDNVQDARKLQLATVLFYKLLENILTNEKKINKDINSLLQKKIFYECLFPCSLEIVIHSYKSQKEFPWILTALDIPAMNFVLIIELIIRSKDQLSRDMVKHLSYVEESILESIMWQAESTLWNNLTKIPKFEEIALPGNMICNSPPGAVSTSSRRVPSGVPQSPAASAVESFQSPVNIQKKLTVKPGQSLLQTNRKTPTHLMVTYNDGIKKFIPIEQTTVVPTSPVPVTPVTPVEPAQPKKCGSLEIILRKFYNLAAVRMECLCEKLNIADDELKRKIWTVFEHSVRDQSNLLKGRHLDQLLMCAVYIICKITNNADKKFTEIMKCYKVQPQANSTIYRNVLIRVERESEDGPEVERKSSLIEFYNRIYVQVMKGYILMFSKQRAPNEDLTLSPLPLVRPLLVSPRHQITRNVFIKPYESPSNTSSSSLSYYFSRSASKDLKDINNAINCGVCVKRVKSEGLEELPNKRFANRKISFLN